MPTVTGNCGNTYATKGTGQQLDLLASRCFHQNFNRQLDQL